MSNHNSKFNERAKRPQALAGAMGGLMRMFGGRASDSDLVARWREIVGDDVALVASVCAVKKMRDNRFNIVIRPTNPAYTLQLSYQVNDVTTRINKYFGYDAVGKISFRK